MYLFLDFKSVLYLIGYKTLLVLFIYNLYDFSVFERGFARLLKLKGLSVEQVIGVAGGELELTGLGDEVTIRIVESELRLGYLEGDLYGLACCDLDLLECDERLDRAHGGCKEIAHIELNYLFTATVTIVTYGDRYVYHGVVCHSVAIKLE